MKTLIMVSKNKFKNERRLTAIMFTDIVGYTALMGKDERLAHALIKKNSKIQLSLIQHYKGSCIKEMGDGLISDKRSFMRHKNPTICASRKHPSPNRYSSGRCAIRKQ